MQRMRQDAEEAQEAIIAAPYASDGVLAGLARRWQQREAVYRAMRQYIESLESQKKMLLESAERSVPPDGEQDREIA